MRSLICAVALVCIGSNASAQAPARIRMAVVPMSFTAPSAGEYDGAAVAAALTDRINTGITALGRFDVIERLRLDEILREQALGQSGIMDESTVAQVGSVAGVELVIMGSITSYTVSRIETVKGTVSYQARITLGARFVDSESGQVRKAAEISVNALDPSYEKAEAKAQDRAVAKIVDEIRFLYPLSATVARVDGKYLYITLGANMGLKPGMRFKTVNPGKEIIDPASGQLLGVEKVETGVVKVVSVDENFARAQVLKDKGRIGVGDEVLEMRATTRFGVTLAYGGAGLSGTPRTVEDTIWYNYGGTLVHDTVRLAGTTLPPMSHWLTLGLDVSEIQNTNLATQLVFMWLPAAGELSGWMFDWNVSWNFPLSTDRLWLPLGAGAALGRLSYPFKYANEFESRFGGWDYDLADSEPRLVALTFGFEAFGGLRLRLAKHLDAYVRGGYRFHFVSSPWEIEYRSGVVDESGNEKKERFEVEKRFLPYTDVALRGPSIRAGLTVAF